MQTSAGSMFSAVSGTPVSLGDVLELRDRRAALQNELLRQYELPLVSFTLNIAGEIKRYKVGDIAFRDGCQRLTAALGAPVYSQISYENAGVQAVFVYGLPPEAIKQHCEAIEDSHPAGRLFDMDVIAPGRGKLSRSIPRKCFVCGREARICARSRAHGLDNIKNAMFELFRAYYPGRIADLAVQALIDEAELTPKPGLVDMHDSGAHRDMDINTFRSSAHALRSYFAEAAYIGASEADCMERLQARGRQAEKEMFAATGGINTHIGAIYALGLLAASLLYGNPFEHAARLAQAGSYRDSTRPAVVEAMNGFPSVQAGLNVLASGKSSLEALYTIMSTLRDSNILKRGGEDALKFVQTAAQNRVNPEALNAQLICRNLSPGGSADMLAAALMLKATLP